MPREVRIGSQPIGGVRVPVLLRGPGGDIRRGAGNGPGMLVEVAPPRAATPSGPPELPSRLPPGDAAIVDTGAADAAGARTTVASWGVPVLLRRATGGQGDQPISPRRWLAAASSCASAGAGAVLLCEGDSRAAPDLAVLGVVRAASDLPVVVDVSAAPELTGAAIVAGADGIVLPADTSAEGLAMAGDLATTLAPFARTAEPTTVGAAREVIDQVDACLADLLERRAGLAGTVQSLKPVGGFAGRDPRREQNVIDAMAARAPRLGVARIRRIMAAVIEAGLDLAESEDTGCADGSSPDAGNDPARPNRAPRQRRRADHVAHRK